MKCIIVDDEEFSRNVIKMHVERTEELQLCGMFDNAVDAMNALLNEHIDLMFLDVEMPEMSGLDLVNSLETLPQVVLVTGKRDYAVDAFEYSLTDYLVKPVSYARFARAVQKAKNNLEDMPMLLQDQPNTSEGDQENKQEVIYVKADNKINRIELSSIYFIEALSDYVIINTEKRRFIVHATMKGLEQRLPSEKFARVHRSYIVNLSRVETIEDYSIIMPQKVIPIGNSYKASFLSKLNFL